MGPTVAAEFDEIVRALGEMADTRGRRIGPETQLYRDLGLSGDDLWDIFVWLHDRFGVDLTGMRLADYARDEAGLFDDMFWPFWSKRYAPLTVIDLVDLVRSGSFSASGLARRRFKE